MPRKIFITGVSAGIGAALTDHYAKQGDQVFGISRRGYQGSATIREQQCDLAKLDLIPVALSALFHDQHELDLVVLNAGILGPIAKLHETDMETVRRVMDINLWSNKIVLDWFIDNGLSIRQIVLISSGASINGNAGWNVYSISKAALNMMTQLYAHEFPDTHLSALAPGIVDTAMQTTLCEQTDSEICPSVSYLQSARGTDEMPTPSLAAPMLSEAFDKLLSQASGGYHDIRAL